MNDILKKLPRGLVEASRLVMESKFKESLNELSNPVLNSYINKFNNLQESNNEAYDEGHTLKKHLGFVHVAYNHFNDKENVRLEPKDNHNFKNQNEKKKHIYSTLKKLGYKPEHQTSKDSQYSSFIKGHHQVNVDVPEVENPTTHGVTSVEYTHMKMNHNMKPDVYGKTKIAGTENGHKIYHRLPGHIKMNEENLQEASKTTLRSYIRKAEDSVTSMSSGRGRKSADVKSNIIKRKSNIETAKEKLSKIISKENEAQTKTHAAKVNDVHNHFQKESKNLLAKHGYTKVHQANDDVTYHKGHNNGHSTFVHINTNPNGDEPHLRSIGSKFNVYSTNGAGTLHGHNHNVSKLDDLESNKTEAMHKFHSVLIDHDKMGKEHRMY